VFRDVAAAATHTSPNYEMDTVGFHRKSGAVHEEKKFLLQLRQTPSSSNSKAAPRRAGATHWLCM